MMADGKMSRSFVVIVSLCAMVVFLSYCLIQVSTKKMDQGRFASIIASQSGNTNPSYANQNIQQPLEYSSETDTADIAIATENKRETSTTKSLQVKRKTNEKCEKRLPTVILVGSQKSGTSAFNRFANYHPQIASLMRPDEARYFTMHYDSHSLDWYRRMMPCSYINQITMEKTPGYFYGNVTATRIKRMNKSTKILMIFKDPVEVAISIFAMWKEHKDPRVKGKKFEDMIIKLDSNGEQVVNALSSIIWYSTFILHAKTWVDTFGKKQVYAFDGSAFEENPRKELQMLESVLGLKHFFKKEHFIYSKLKKKFCFAVEPKSIECLPSNKGRAHPSVSKKVISLLRNYFKPFNAQLSKLMERTFTWQ